MPKVARTLIPALVLLGLALYPGSETALIGICALLVAALLFIPWAIYSLVRMVIRPAERKDRGIRLAIWAAALVLAFGGRSEWDENAREEANRIATAVVAHKDRTGAYPKALTEVGFEPAALKEKYSLSYRANGGKAALFYSQPSMPMVAHHYDFERKSWNRAD